MRLHAIATLLALCASALGKTLVITTPDDTSRIYAVGARLNIAWTSSGASLPFSVTVRDYDTDSQKLATYPLTVASGATSLVLPSSLPPEVYDVWLCDRVNFCSAYFTIVRVAAVPQGSSSTEQLFV